jgi:uncharacterized membrane protein YfcA
MSKINSTSARLLCFLLGAMMGLSAFFVGYSSGSLLRNIVFGLLVVLAATYLLLSVFGSDKWRSRLIGFAP